MEMVEHEARREEHINVNIKSVSELIKTFTETVSTGVIQCLYNTGWKLLPSKGQETEDICQVPKHS